MSSVGYERGYLLDKLFIPTAILLPFFFSIYVNIETRKLSLLWAFSVSKPLKTSGVCSPATFLLFCWCLSVSPTSATLVFSFPSLFLVGFSVNIFSQSGMPWISGKLKQDFLFSWSTWTFPAVQIYPSIRFYSQCHYFIWDKYNNSRGTVSSVAARDVASPGSDSLALVMAGSIGWAVGLSWGGRSGRSRWGQRDFQTWKGILPIKRNDFVLDSEKNVE